MVATNDNNSESETVDEKSKRRRRGVRDDDKHLAKREKRRGTAERVYRTDGEVGYSGTGSRRLSADAVSRSLL